MIFKIITKVCHVTAAAAKSLSHVQLFVTPWTGAQQAPLVHGILRAKILEWVAIPSYRGFS